MAWGWAYVVDVEESLFKKGVEVEVAVDYKAVVKLKLVGCLKPFCLFYDCLIQSS